MVCPYVYFYLPLSKTKQNMRYRLLSTLLVLMAFSLMKEAFAATIRGRVTCDGQPLKGVMITDGITATKTSKLGE